MKVYIIQQGEYSDRCIVGITLTEERAKEIKEIADRSNTYYESDIMEYDTDRLYDAKAGDTYYSVLFSPKELFVGEAPIDVDFDNVNRVMHGPCNDIVYVFAKDKEEAVKKASDVRASFYAKMEGIV